MPEPERSFLCIRSAPASLNEVPCSGAPGFIGNPCAPAAEAKGSGHWSRSAPVSEHSGVGALRCWSALAGEAGVLRLARPECSGNQCSAYWSQRLRPLKPERSGVGALRCRSAPVLERSGWWGRSAPASGAGALRKPVLSLQQTELQHMTEVSFDCMY